MPQYCHLDCDDTTIATYPGNPYPLGAYYDGHGINFALYSEFATKVHLCLFRQVDDEKQDFVEYTRINMKGWAFSFQLINVC
jgi:pullulanase/glycogen debranching enzyme